jgi:hypothetical protein
MKNTGTGKNVGPVWLKGKSFGTKETSVPFRERKFRDIARKGSSTSPDLALDPAGSLVPHPILQGLWLLWIMGAKGVKSNNGISTVLHFCLCVNEEGSCFTYRWAFQWPFC